MPTVWILGAGFSRSLGAPLLPELLSSSSMALLKIQFPDLIHLHSEPLALEAYKLRSFGQHNHNPSESLLHASVTHWHDAEDYLSFLDRAADGGTLECGALKSMDVNDPVGLSLAAKRIVAMECSTFLMRWKDTDEQFDPYRKWADSIREDPSHTVLTFNYDGVPEKIGLWTPTPDEFAKAQPNGLKLAPVLKLHGSADWQIEGPRIWKENFLVPKNRHAELVIGTPGRMKVQIAEKLRPFWDYATARLREADEIYIVGYRFPSSDAQSYTRLMGAIESGTDAHVRVSLVLGPRGGEDLARLQLVLDAITRHRKRPGTAGKKHRSRVDSYTLRAEEFIPFWRRFRN